jgi:hypothetical protein
MNNSDTLDTFVCNCCLSNLTEIRYKCIQCPDYDICQNCICRTEYRNDGHYPIDHILWKIDFQTVSQKSKIQTSETIAFTLLEELSVLDAFQLFQLDVNAMSAQLKMPVQKITFILDRMFDNESKSTILIENELCPGLTADNDDDVPMRDNNDYCRPSLTSTWEHLVDISEKDSGKIF